VTWHPKARLGVQVESLAVVMLTVSAFDGEVIVGDSWLVIKLVMFELVTLVLTDAARDAT